MNGYKSFVGATIIILIGGLIAFTPLDLRLLAGLSVTGFGFYGIGMAHKSQKTKSMLDQAVGGVEKLGKTIEKKIRRIIG